MLNRSTFSRLRYLENDQTICCTFDNDVELSLIKSKLRAIVFILNFFFKKKTLFEKNQITLFGSVFLLSLNLKRVYRNSVYRLYIPGPDMFSSVLHRTDRWSHFPITQPDLFTETCHSTKTSN